ALESVDRKTAELKRNDSFTAPPSPFTPSTHSEHLENSTTTTTTATPQHFRNYATKSHEKQDKVKDKVDEDFFFKFLEEPMKQAKQKREKLEKEKHKEALPEDPSPTTPVLHVREEHGPSTDTNHVLPAQQEL